jgi:hypothetical protein
VKILIAVDPLHCLLFYFIYDVVTRCLQDLLPYFSSLFLHVCMQTYPVDLTRSMDSKPSTESSEKETPKRLAFSVENILDPNKFTGNRRHYGQSVNGLRLWSSSIDRDDKMDDDQSDDHSSELTLAYFLSNFNNDESVFMN